MPQDAYHYFHRAWSLAVEEQFYLVWPALVVMLGFVRPAFMIIGLIGLSVLAILGLFGQPASDWNLLLVPYRTILLGCLVAIALNRKTLYEPLGRAFSSAFAAPALLVILVVYIGLQSGPIEGLDQLLVHLLMAAFLTSCVINEKNHLHYLLTLKWVQLIGVISYGIYILHGQLWGPTHKVLSLIPGGDWAASRELFFILFTVLSSVIAYISFVTYERYFLILKKRYEVK